MNQVDGCISFQQVKSQNLILCWVKRYKMFIHIEKHKEKEDEILFRFSESFNSHNHHGHGTVFTLKCNPDNVYYIVRT